MDDFEIIEETINAADLAEESPFVNGTASLVSVPSPDDAEAALIGLILAEPDRMPEVLPLVRGEDFSDGNLRTIWEAAVRRFENGYLDIITVCQDLNDRGDLTRIGGAAFVASLSDLATSGHARPYIEIMREKSLRRKVNMTGLKLAEAFDLDDIQATIRDLNEAYEARSVALSWPGRPLNLFTVPLDDDESNLLGTNRYLVRGDSLLIVGNAGMGKSSIQTQAAIHWALGRDFMGIPCSKPLKSLIVQAEDSDGDVGECWESCVRYMELSEEQKQQVGRNVQVIHEKSARGDDFIRKLAGYCRYFSPDLVWVNPLHSFMDGDIKDASSIGKFCREGLNGINLEDKWAYVILHHTTKPPTGKDAVERNWNEVMYDYAGSADLVNFARATISLKAKKNQGQFDLVLAKRGKRAGVYREVPQGIGMRLEITTKIAVQHCDRTFKIEGREKPLGMIYWELADEDVESETETKAPDKKKGGRPTQFHIKKVLGLIPRGSENKIPRPQIARELADKTGISRRTLKRITDELEERGSIMDDDGHLFRPGFDDELPL